MPEDLIGRIHELAITNSADVDNVHDDILDYNDSSEYKDPNELLVNEDEYNCKVATDHNSREPSLDPVVEKYVAELV